jgi:flagellar protein FliS
MNQSAYAISAYQAAIRTTPPLKAIVLLYDKALTCIACAAAAASRGDYQTQFDEVRKAVKIFNGLNNCLDMEQGGRVAASLREMYLAVVKALYSSVGYSTGEDALRRVASAVRVTRDAWAEISGVPLSGASIMPALETPVHTEIGG